MSATATAVTAAEKPVRRFPPPCWTQDEALALIQTYRERWYALRRGYLRTADWDAVAEEVGRICPGAIPPKTSAQCRHKMEKLRQRYRAEKQRALTFPGAQFLSTWFYFEAMDSMERNGTGSNPDDETQSGNSLGLKIANLKNNHQQKTSVDPDSIYGGLNPGRGIRFKPDSNLVSVASRVLNNYASRGEDEVEDGYFVETPMGKNLGKTPKLYSQNYATRFQSEHHSRDGDFDHSGGRPRKISKIDSNTHHSYWNENGEDGDGDEEEVEEGDFKRKYGEQMVGSKRDNEWMGEIVSSIKVLADGFMKMEKMKMDMVHEIERKRMEAEMKRNELILESQKHIVEAFIKGFAVNRKQQQ